MADIELVIKIPKQIYSYIRTYEHIAHSDVLDIKDAIMNGTPIPDNATNGEIMQMVFPNGVTAKFATFMRFVVGEDEYINCAYDWWNAPYQKDGKV